MNKYYLNYLDELESEAIYVIREARAQFDNPVILFSGGKDSIIVTHLAKKAFYPAQIPFPLLHVDTGHNFPETIKFRNEIVNELDLELIVASVQEQIDQGLVIEEQGKNASRNILQISTLLDVIEKNNIDCAIGGGRRDEEKARAKERFFSHRDDFGQWDPKNQRPELWDLYNGKHFKGEHFRVFPISNWTEMDVWQYAKIEEIELPSLYFAHEREVLERNGSLLAITDFVSANENEEVKKETVRFRTIGDATCTGAVISNASNLDEVIAEVSATRITERGSRADDKRSEAAMEDRKKQGYF